MLCYVTGVLPVKICFLIFQKRKACLENADVILITQFLGAILR